MKNLVQSKGNYGGGMTFLPLRRMKPVSLGFILLLLCNTLLGYSLYVDAAADPNLSDGTSAHPYVQIQNAIDHLQNEEGAHTIQVAPGIYNAIVIDDPVYESLKIISTIPRTAIINGNAQTSSVKISHTDRIDLIGLIIENGHPSLETVIAHNSYWVHGIPIPIVTQVSLDEPGGGIRIVDSEHVGIENCIIQNNKAFLGGGIFALCTARTIPQESGHPCSLRIDNCDINNNISVSGPNMSLMGNGSAIALYSVNAVISNSRIIENGRVAHDPLVPTEVFGPSDIIWIFSFCEDNIFNVLIDRSCICNNNAKGNVIKSYMVEGNFDILNSNICFNSTHEEHTIYNSTYDLAFSRHVNILNTIIHGNVCSLYSGSDYLQIYNGICEPRILLTLKNDLITGVGFLDYGDQSSNAYWGDADDNANLLSCLDEDPLFVDPVNNDYSLRWLESQRSPCINAGYTGINGDSTDPDGTPPDIGAIYYPHHQMKYFERMNPSGIYWLSFPVVDDRTNTEGTYWNELGYMFESHMQGPPTFPSQLDKIEWSYDGEKLAMTYDAQNEVWTNRAIRSDQPKGYKAKFNTTLPMESVIVNGFKANPSTTPVSWAATVNENGQDRPFENWIGYFVPYTQRAGDAFSLLLPNSNRDTYLDYICSIKTQTWSNHRLNDTFGSPWIKDPNDYTLSEGDMVALYLFPNAPIEMYWKNLTSSVPSAEKPRATAFSYEEKLDYTPVYLEFDPLDLPAEVGLYVNGECKGASVVDSCVVDVPLYKDEAKDSGELQIICYYDGKGKKAVSGWKVYDAESMVFVDTTLRVEQIDKYAYLSLKHQEGDSPVPLTTDLQPNYPNPFNPDTNISFVLSKAMPIRMDIYNVRGQKVRTLCNAEFATGKHTITWNGKDEHNRIVTSGIYFTRLTTPEGSFSQKMMFMK